MRVSAEIEDRRWTLQTKDLSLRNVAIFAVLVVAQEESIDPAVRDEAFARIRHVILRVRGENCFDQIVRETFAYGSQFCHRNSGKCAMPALQFDLRLHRSFFHKRLLSSAGIEALQETL